MASVGAQVVRAFATLREMLEDRGFGCASLESVSDLQLRELVLRSPVFSLDLDLTTERGEGDDANVHFRILFHLLPKIKVADVARRFHGSDNNIMVVRDKMTPSSQKGLKDVPHELFELRELQYNVTRHSLVPRHDIVTDGGEEAGILRDHGLKAKTQLPLISRADPVARYLGLRPGQLVRVTRISRTSGECVAYRCCV